MINDTTAKALQVFRGAWAIVYTLIAILGVIILFVPCFLIYKLKKLGAKKKDGVIDIE